MTEALQAERLVARFGVRQVLDGVELTVQPGCITALVGPNGAGKSTLLSCLAGLRRPDAGEVRLGGEPLAALTPRRRAQAIGYLPQSPEIAWRLEVESFVGLGRIARQGGLGPSAEDRAAVAAALASTGLEAFARRDVTTLSGGERARALIARALAGAPGWLIADEPLTGLDLGHQFDVADLLRAFAAGGGGVLVTMHDLQFAAQCADRVVVLAEGRLIADGPAHEALVPAVLARAYGVDARWTPGAGGPLLDVAGRLG